MVTVWSYHSRCMVILRLYYGYDIVILRLEHGGIVAMAW